MSDRADARATARAPSGPGQAIRDGLIITWRNLKRVPRIPELAIFAILQSIMFVLLAEWNPTSTLASALRELWGNPNPFASSSFPSQEPVLVTLGWVVAIIAIFGTLSVRRYRSMSR